MKSTADCKKFLAEFFKRNPQILAHWDTAEDPTVQNMAETEHLWKRIYKCKPGKDFYCSMHGCELDGNEDYQIYVDGAPGNRYGDGHKTMYPHQFVSERGFDCDPLEGQLAYVVLEDHEGNMHLGTYIGD